MKENYFEDGVSGACIDDFLQHPAPFRKRLKGRFLPASSALLVLDMQDYFLSGDSHAFVPASGAIVPKINALQEAFCREGLPIYRTRHLNDADNAGQMGSWWREVLVESNPLSRIAEEVAGTDAETVVKSQYDAFYNTDLEKRLRDRGVTQVVVTGVMAHLCCETTARAAFVRGFEVFFVIDAVASYNREFHKAALLNLSHGFAVPLLTGEILDAFVASGGPAGSPKGGAPWNPDSVI
ncbi:MAG: isochorismatase family protein [bacterium]|nr:isochorismatase family protein [bacterium]